MAGKVAVVDFVCPTYITRLEFNADYTVWMNTIKEGRFEDTNALFEKPDYVDYHVEKWFDDTPQDLLNAVNHWRENNV